MTTLRLLGLSGSLRRASLNTALLRLAAEVAPDDVEVVIHPLGDLPFYDGDVEAAGWPASVTGLRHAIAEADGLLLASPEYNRSTTAVLKNAIDWASRRRPDSPLDEQHVALLSAAGGSGGSNAQRHLRDILEHNRVSVLDASFRLQRARDALVDGAFVDPAHRRELGRVVAGLAARIRATAGDRTEVA
jgi:chromate reductase, NAD(P)H dehydrogenase (quinone)